MKASPYSLAPLLGGFRDRGEKIMSPRPTRILILGGGFGGVYTALTLEQLLRRDLRRGAVELTLVNRENYMVFQPMLPEVISGSIGLVDTITPIRRLCPNTNLYTRPIEKIDIQRRRVITAAGLGTRPCEIEYDHLVIALGNVPSLADLPGLAEHALPFKYLGDALTLRNRVIHTLEEADIEPDPQVRRALLTFVVAGGGFSGVEVVAELNDFVRAVARNFRHLNAGDIRVILVHAGEVIFPELPRSLAEFAQRLLLKRGVEVRLRTRLAGATAEAALLEGGERIATRTLVSTVSSVPNSLVASLPVKKERGRVVVDSHLAVPDYPGVWAVGDCAFVVDGESGEPCAPTAQHAIRQARRLAENLVATLRGAPKTRFAFTALGKMASLGHRSAVGEIFGVRVSGFLAWWLWRTMYLMKLPGIDRKIRVATDWTLDLILPPDIVQLTTEKPLAIRREHFEPNETIFREGDWGDSLYIILDSEVEITRDVPGQSDVPLARLGCGECFGEMGLVRQMPRSATVRTVTRVNVLAMDRYAFQALFAHLPPLRLFFEQLIQRRTI
ncbi:MAG TPA: FAD-dependent oxidoreductase [Candidatus Acidoferrales bacterium]|nr:FAD-dependent oxidoreductase [Candidatus Acidoferrales bacterium]